MSHHMVSWITLLVECLKAALDEFRIMFNIGFAGFYKPLELQHQDSDRNVALVTGVDSGLGYNIALSRAKQNALVFLACRSRSRKKTTGAEIINVSTS